MVQGVRRPIEQKRGHFIAGKFEQFQQNTPYSALIQAFRKLVQLLLAEKDLDLWKERFLKALGFDAQIMIDAIPELKPVLVDDVLFFRCPSGGAASSSRFAALLELLKKDIAFSFFSMTLRWLMPPISETFRVFFN